MHITKTNRGSEVLVVSEECNWMTVKETAALLQIPLTRCYMLIHAGELPAVRIGERSIRLHREELETFLKDNRRIVP